MPETFQPELLRSRLGAFMAAASEPTILAYQNFYGLELSARYPGLESRLGSFQAAGYRIAAQFWRPANTRGSLLLLHGYYDHMGLYGHVLDWALHQGFAVLACDLPGHGLSDGKPASIGDFSEYQQVLYGLFEQAELLDLPKPWHLFGQSTGAAIVLDYLLTHEAHPNLGKSILFSPLVRPRAWGWSKLSYWLLRPFVDSIPRHFTHNSNDQAFLDFLQQDDPLQSRRLPTAWVGALARWIPRIEAAPPKPQKLLIVQGDLDGTVNWQHNLKVLQDKFQDLDCLLVKGARHHLANELPKLREDYFAFLSNRLS